MNDLKKSPSLAQMTPRVTVHCLGNFSQKRCRKLSAVSLKKTVFARYLSPVIDAHMFQTFDKFKTKIIYSDRSG